MPNAPSTHRARWAAASPERVSGDPDAWAKRVTPVVMSAVPGFMLQRLVVPDFNEEAYLDALLELYIS